MKSHPQCRTPSPGVFGMFPIYIIPAWWFIVPYGGRDLYGVKSIKEETEYPLMSVDGVFIATAFPIVFCDKLQIHSIFSIFAMRKCPSLFIVHFTVYILYAWYVYYFKDVFILNLFFK